MDRALSGRAIIDRSRAPPSDPSGSTGRRGPRGLASPAPAAEYDRHVDALRFVVSPGTRSNRILRAALVLMTAGASVLTFVRLSNGFTWAVDAIIPLTATARWAAGGQPYLASAFQQPPGYDLPFLYPPPVLPFLAPLLLLPGALVVAAWMLVGLAAAVASTARLGIPFRWIAVVLVWPPLAEAILGGNVQTVLFLAFVLLYVGPRAMSRPWRPAAQDPRASTRPAVIDGALAASIGALKLSQAYVWANLLRRRPRAAIAGASLAVAIALVTLPFVGLETWGAWVDQLARAADPEWARGGFGLEVVLVPAARPVLLLVGLVLAFLAPADDAGASVGAVLVVFGQSLRMFGVLFLVPAMLRIRRELALVAAMFIATYTTTGLWLGIGIVVAAHLGSRRYPALREPDPDTITAVASDPVSTPSAA